MFMTPGSMVRIISRKERFYGTFAPARKGIEKQTDRRTDTGITLCPNDFVMDTQ